MLSVKLLPSNSEILKLEYLDQPDFENLIVVCPSPQKADGVRSHLQELGINANVLTISKFISNCLSVLGEEAPKVSRKSELLLKLSTIWKIKYPSQSYDIFTKAFNLYTELRGFSLNLEMLEEVLLEEEESLATAIRFFWLVSEELGLYDEHFSYGFLTEEIRSQESLTHAVIDEKNIIFIGFKHLSGGQLDLLKSIGIRANVTIALHQELYRNAEHNSWVGWLDASDEGSKSSYSPSKIEVFRYKKGRFSEDANEKIEELLTSGAQIYLPSSSQKFEEINVLPADDIFFKTSIDPFKPILTSLINHLKNLTDFGKKEISKTNILDVFEEIESVAVAKNYFFRWLKIKSQFLRLFDEWSELSEANTSFTFFDAEVFFEILDLDLPRNYLIPLFEKEPTRFLSSLDDAEIASSENVLLIGGSFLGSLKSGENKFSDIQMENLSALGPVRSSELDFLNKKIAFRDLVNTSKVQIILEENFEETDISWLELLESFEIVNFRLKSTLAPKTNSISNKIIRHSEKPKKLSATSLQTYLDCPRKFYYKHVEKIRIEPVISESLRPLQLGIIEHLVIGKFFEDESQDLSLLITSELNKFLAKENLTIKSVQYQEAVCEIDMLSRRGIEFVKGLSSFFGKGERSFEKEFENKVEDVLHRGSIDFFYEGEGGFSIIDFKRSGGGIPGVGEFLNFKKIQAWYYLNHVENPSENAALFGYLNLKDPAASLVYTTSRELKNQLKDYIGHLGIKISHFDNFEGLLNDYKSMESDLITKYQNDIEFNATPLDADACSYCPVSYICDRGQK